MSDSPNKLSLLFADLKRRGVTRLATIYAVAGLGVIEAFDIIAGRFLMPDWTIRVVIILVLVGFPITMILGWIYDITSKGIIKTEALTPSQQASLPSLSWKPSWISIILLVILILTTTAFFTVPRPNALGFKGQDWILIADLENNTTDDLFDKTLLHALTVTIDQSRHINIYPRTQVDEVLKRMQRDTVKTIDVRIALEIAERQHIKAVLVPTISELGGTYVLSTRLLNPMTGESVRSSQVQANGKDEILTALDKLATAVRKDLGESLRKIHLRTVPLYQATTHSLEALKCLTNASLVTGGFFYEREKELLHEAIKLDPEFALAHSNLAAYYYWTNDRLRGEEHITIALDLLDRLTEKEKLWIQAAVEGYRGNRDVSVIKWGTFLSKYPNDYGGWFRLGYNYMMLGRNEESISAFTRALEIFNDEDPAVLVNIATAYGKLNEYQKAIEYYLRSFKQRPDDLTHPQLNHEFGFTYVQAGELDKAKEVFEKLMNGNDNQKAQYNRSLALLSMYQGKYTEAVNLMHEAIVIQKSIGVGLSELRNRLYLAKIYQRTGMKDKFIAELDHCSELIINVATEPWWYMYVGKMIIRNGDIEKAEVMLEEIQNRTNKGNRNDETAYSLIKGEIELLKGNHAKSLELLETATTLNVSAYTIESLANYYFQLGDWEKAIATYEDIISDRDALGWEGQECWVQALLNLGIVYEEMDNNEKATYYYQQFLEIWKEADADLPDLL
ncbi:MAG: tetratricopeptide repeat protein, partial [Bacteroidales bacterium]|nr:tetratricopeptide repeat protein [Bacteroidales bacterium]